MKSKFVLSRKAYDSLKEAGEKATGLLEGGQLLQNTRCFKVVKVYKATIKFKEIK